ncbi:MAG: hypothetical protein ACRC8B_21525 [Aeromonas sobria]|jgi:hypothetical protein|uniref:hypothetical protein n=1 Tax=Aeromonas sobria TaxID=646 RepID=UPI003F2A6536
MTKSILSRAAKFADQIVATIADQLNGSRARRAALHRLATSIADDIRSRKLDKKRVLANVMLGRSPCGHRLMINLQTDYLRNAV